MRDRQDYKAWYYKPESTVIPETAQDYSTLFDLRGYEESNANKKE